MMNSFRMYQWIGGLNPAESNLKNPETGSS